MPKPVSRAQAALLGAVAGGRARKAPGMKPAEARGRLRGVKVSKLPKRAGSPALRKAVEKRMSSHGSHQVPKMSSY